MSFHQGPWVQSVERAFPSKMSFSWGTEEMEENLKIESKKKETDLWRKSTDPFQRKGLICQDALKLDFWTFKMIFNPWIGQQVLF